MTAVDRLRDANRYELKLANGIPITYRLPFMEELVIVGILPLSLLDELRKRMEDGGTQAEAESIAEETMGERLANFERDYAAKQRLVAIMIESIDGEAVSMAPEETQEIPPEDFHQLVGAAMSRTPVRAEGEV